MLVLMKRKYDPSNASRVASTTAWQRREVQGAVRLLVISPEDPGAPDRLKSLLIDPAAAEGQLVGECECQPTHLRGAVPHRYSVPLPFKHCPSPSYGPRTGPTGTRGT